MSIKVKPGEERLAIVRDTAEDMSEGGLVIPQGAREIPNSGVIIAVGESSTAEPSRMDIFMAGDRVVFGQFAGVDMTIDGVGVTFISALDVLGVIEKSAKVKAKGE